MTVCDLVLRLFQSEKTQTEHKTREDEDMSHTCAESVNACTSVCIVQGKLSGGCVVILEYGDALQNHDSQQYIHSAGKDCVIM